MKVVDYLQLVRKRLDSPGVSCREVASLSGVGYDSVLRMKGTKHDPSYSSVVRVAQCILADAPDVEARPRAKKPAARKAGSNGRGKRGQ